MFAMRKLFASSVVDFPILAAAASPPGMYFFSNRFCKKRLARVSAILRAHKLFQMIV